MSVQFEWQAGSDDGQWETIARTGRGPGRRWLGRVPWWAWVVAGLVVAGLSMAGYLAVRRRYAELQRQVEFQIQSVIDLEARAFAQGNADLFLDQQDSESSEWYAQQAQRVGESCRRRLAIPFDAESAARDPCTPVQPAEIHQVDLQGEIAWVEVIEGRPSVRRVRFYRQTPLGWKHTAPRASFWKTAIRVQYGELFVQYHQRDTPEVVFLEELIATTYAKVCATTLCPAVNTLTVDFSIDTPVYQSPYLEADPAPDGRDRLVLSSPWLSGMPVEGEWDEDTIESLTHAVAYATLTRAMRSTTKRDLLPLWAAIADEYALWLARGETAGLPLLGPIIDSRGEQVVPALLLSAKGSRTSSEFLSQWLGLSLGRNETETDRARSYFEALLNLERQALRAGRKQTFLMFQDTDWYSTQSRYYERVQRSIGSFPRREVRVLWVQVWRGHARVRLAEPLSTFQGQPAQSQNAVTYFRLEDGDWRHTSVLDAAFWMLQPQPTPSAVAPSSLSLAIPAPVPGS